MIHQYLYKINNMQILIPYRLKNNIFWSYSCMYCLNVLALTLKQRWELACRFMARRLHYYRREKRQFRVTKLVLYNSVEFILN